MCLCQRVAGVEAEVGLDTGVFSGAVLAIYILPLVVLSRTESMFDTSLLEDAIFLLSS